VSSGGGAEEVTTLRVRGMDGHKMHILKLKFDDTIGTLRQYLAGRYRRNHSLFSSTLAVWPVDPSADIHLS
jgi:hypothetical protein